MANKLANEIELVDAFDATSKTITNAELLALVAALSTRELTANGIKREGSAGAYTYSVNDETKFSTWLASVQPVVEVLADPDAAARVWLTTDKDITEVTVDDDQLVEGLVQAFSFRRSRVDRNIITSVGFRINVIDETGRVRNRRPSVHINYAKAIVASAKGIAETAVTDKMLEEWAMSQKGKGLLFQRRTQEAGKTGYMARLDKLNAREKEVYEKLTDKTKVHTRITQLGTSKTTYIGFIHMSSGASYSISSELTEQETEELKVQIDAAKTALTEAMKERMLTEAKVQGEETRLEAQLLQLKSLLEKKLLTKEEYNTRRTALLAKI